MSDDPDSILGFVESVAGDAYLKVEESLGEGYVRLRVSEAERRQAKHDIRSVEDTVVELLRNARDAHAQRVFIATAREGDARRLTVIDDGVGIPVSMHGRVFEPRVTSKLDSMVVDTWGVHGRGMALFSIKSNVTEACVASSDQHKGTALSITVDTRDLPERSDQSSWPALEPDAAGLLRPVRGPHNILRRVVEFACEHADLDLFIGSPVEILATLTARAATELDTSELLFCDDLDRLSIWQRPAAASDARDLCDIAAGIGLDVSERSAHRILAGELAPLDTVMSQASVEEEPPPSAPPDIYRDRRGLRIDHSDLTQFRRDLLQAFDRLAGSYYLHLKGDPRVHVGRDDIRVRFEIEKDE